MYNLYVYDIALSSDIFQFAIYADETTVTSTMYTFKGQCCRIKNNKINNELNKFN